EKGAGPNWLFDIDSLTKSMNYVPVDAADQIETLTVESPIPTDSSPVPTACLNDSPEPSSEARLISKRVANQEETPSLNNILSLTNWFEDIIGIESSTDEAIGVEVDAQVQSGGRTKFYCYYSSEDKSCSSSVLLIFMLDALHDPSWVEAMQEELLQFKIQKVWSLVYCPKGVRPIGTKWVLKNKKDERGIVVRNKARLVAQGHTQEEGIDYDEAFSPVSRIKAIRLFLACASFMSFTVYQMDVKSAFLYGTIDEEVLLDFRVQSIQPESIKWKKLFYQIDVKSAFLYGTIDEEVHQMTPKECHLHADTDYGGATQDRKSTTGGCQFLGRRLISWQCKKQIIVATSITKAEYVATASCCGQVLWIQNQLLDYSEIPVLSYILGVTSNEDESNGVKADVSNMEITITASPTPTLRIHSDHPKSQIIGPVDTLIQTRNKSKEVREQRFIATIHQKTDPALLQFCLFSCFLSQVEP
nr:putative ribonuclease H-like domain-containing protein [Tanacetum cinerariifolium]